MSGPIQTVTVLGAGAFGTALALAAARAGRAVILLARNSRAAADINDQRENRRHMPAVTLPEAIRATADPAAIGTAELLLVAVPAQATRAALGAVSRQVRPGLAVVACAKGIEAGSGALQTDIIREILPDCLAAALSGPGFAEEIARGLPTALTVAADDIGEAHRICGALGSSLFRPYASDDLVGVEFGGAAKNVLAIACGVVVGRALGESARAALISRGLAEMIRLGGALGARAETFMGLSGLGDLVLTATSAQSRNTRFGAALGEGRQVNELLGDGTPLAEGAHTAAITAALAEKHGISTPIIAAVAAMIGGQLTVDQAVEGLVRRPLRAEAD